MEEATSLSRSYFDLAAYSFLRCNLASRAYFFSNLRPPSCLTKPAKEKPPSMICSISAAASALTSVALVRELSVPMSKTNSRWLSCQMLFYWRGMRSL